MGYTGQVLSRGNEPHYCRPPMDEYTITVPKSIFAGNEKDRSATLTREPPVGTVWRCACGTLWEVVKNPYRNVLKQGDWRRADWITRLRYRGK